MKKTFFFLLLALLFCTPANAQANPDSVGQPFRLIYQSEPGTRPASIFADGFESGDLSRFDLNGDGKPDMVLIREDDDGNLKSLLVIDLSSSFARDTLTFIQDVPQTLGLAEKDGMKFFGFADVDGDDTNEIVFANGRDVWLVDPSDHSLEWVYSVQVPAEFPVLLRAVIDITDDSFPDIILFLPQTKQVEVWSKPQ